MAKVGACHTKRRTTRVSGHLTLNTRNACTCNNSSKARHMESLRTVSRQFNTQALSVRATLKRDLILKIIGILKFFSLVPSVLMALDRELSVDDYTFWTEDLPTPKSLAGELERWKRLWQSDTYTMF